MLNVEWIEDPQRWQRFRVSWEDVHSKTSRPSIFTSWDFLQASWKYFAEPYWSRLAVLRFYDADGDVGFAPLRISQSRRYGIPLRRLTHLAQWESDRAPFIIASERQPECASAFWNVLEDQMDEWDQVDLHELSPGEPIVRQALIRGEEPSPFKVSSINLPPSAFLGFVSDWEGLLGGMDWNHRQELQRLFPLLEKHGDCELEVCEEADDMAKALEHLVRIEQESQKNTTNRGVGKDHRHLQFYRELLDRLSQRGEVSISFVKQKGVRLSALLEYRFLGKITLAQSTFLSSHASSSPDLIHLTASLKRHLEEGAATYEFAAESLRHQRRWSQHAHENIRLRVVQHRRLKHRVLFPRASMRVFSRLPQRRANLTTN